ncbi:hypothetical protein BDFG_07783, partial [Blastomyces dermatitidis ATCC 26199]
MTFIYEEDFTDLIDNHNSSSDTEIVLESDNEIKYSHDLPEYSKTHMQGYTYVISTEPLNVEKMTQMMNDIQYGKSSVHSFKEIYCSFLHSRVKKYKMIRENAMLFTRAIRALFQEGTSCMRFAETCAPDVTEYHASFISCVNSFKTNHIHYFFRPVQGVTQMNIEFLERILQENLFFMKKKCEVMKQSRSTRKFLNSANCSYILFISHGNHTYSPSPLNKPPATIMNRILTLIQEMREPNMTLSFFLKSPALQKFCDEYNSQSLAEIHISFTNMNRFQAILQKQQLLSFPAGQDYNEVLFQLDQNPALKDYVQNIHQNEEGLMIICMLKEQAALLLSLSSFEVDMSYKHIKSSKMNEVIFATYLPQHGK